MRNSTPPPTGKVPDSTRQQYAAHRDFLERQIIAPILRGNLIRDIEPEDICQDVFVKFFLFQKQNIVENELALLITLARREAYNAVKKKREEPLAQDCSGESDLAAVIGTRLDAKTLKRALLQELKKKFPKNALRDYKIILWRYMFGLEYHEIAERMHVTTNIIEDTLHRKLLKQIAPLLKKRFSLQ